MKQTELKNLSLLLLTAMIWGAAFVAQSAGMEQNGPFTFNTVRMILGGIVLIPCIALFDKMRHVRLGWRSADKNLWMGGCLCGVALFTGATLQQFGIQYTSAGKAGFITALYAAATPSCIAAAKAAPSASLQPLSSLEMPRKRSDRMTPELPRAPRSSAEAVTEAA